jgi:hypothetical protein
MILYIAHAKVLVTVAGAAAKRGYPFLVGGVAFALTMSMLMPFMPILIGTVLARRDRWIAIVLLSRIGRPIAKHLGSGIGLTLQKLDAQITEDVMLAMMQKDRLALPIRDSFITYSGLREPLTELMKASYQARVKAMIGVETLIQHS